MPNILSKLNKKDGEESKLRLIVILIVIFIVFTSAGYLIVMAFTPIPEQPTDEFPRNVTISNNAPEQFNQSSHDGFVKYVDPNFYPNEKISFVLNDENGKEIILLKANDQKLQVAEGHFVTAVGEVMPSEFGNYNYLMVEEVIIKNVTD